MDELEECDKTISQAWVNGRDKGTRRRAATEEKHQGFGRTGGVGRTCDDDHQHGNEDAGSAEKDDRSLRHQQMVRTRAPMSARISANAHTEIHERRRGNIKTYDKTHDEETTADATR